MKSIAALMYMLCLASGAAAQVTVEPEFAAKSAYSWRGVYQVNRPVLEPSLALGVSTGPISWEVGASATIVPAAYRGTSAITMLAGRSAPGLGDATLWATAGRELGAGSVAFGTLVFLAPDGTKVFNRDATAELSFEASYRELALGVYYDFVLVRGVYAEAAWEHAIGKGPTARVLLGASLNETGETGYYERDGLTHVELGLAQQINFGRWWLQPSFQSELNLDPVTKLTTPERSARLKHWVGLTVGWSNGGE